MQVEARQTATAIVVDQNTGLGTGELGCGGVTAGFKHVPR
jgi:hypothetical protein